MTILDEILAHKKREVERQKRAYPLPKIETATANRSFIEKVNKNEQNFHLICEVKKASPSKGVIRTDFNPLEIARSYENGGASAISVLTDEKYFMGKAEYLKEIKANVSIPVLRKDFIVDEYQIIQSKYLGADLILLIAKALEKNQIDDYIAAAANLNMEVLLEFSSDDELDKLPDNYNNVIFGINNRDLHTFTVDIGNSLRLKKMLPADAVVISESGIKTNEDCKRLAEAGFKGALIGETLMRSDQIAEEIRILKNGI
jgi:indole-3-glycerol phosphate synthase